MAQEVLIQDALPWTTKGPCSAKRASSAPFNYRICDKPVGTARYVSYAGTADYVVPWCVLGVRGDTGCLLGSSTGNAARLEIAVASTEWTKNSGAVSFEFWPEAASTGPSGAVYLFAHSAALKFGYDGSDDKFFLTGGTTVKEGSARTWSAWGVKFVVTCSWNATDAWLTVRQNGNGGDVIVKATWTPPTLPTTAYLGCDEGAANHFAGAYRNLLIAGAPLA